jgi:hypothetical protein
VPFLTGHQRCRWQRRGHLGRKARGPG